MFPFSLLVGNIFLHFCQLSSVFCSYEILHINLAAFASDSGPQIMAKWTLITRSFRIQSTLLYAHSPLARISCMSTSTTASTTSGGSDSSGSTTTRKATARKAATTALRSLSPPQMAQESARISSHLHNTRLIHAAAANRIAIYIHCPKQREVDTTAVLK